MADRRFSILVALADRERAGDLAVHLSEEHGMAATLAGALDTDDHAYDAVLSTEPVDDGTPHVILDDLSAGRDPTGNVFAVLPTSSEDALIAAALRLAAAGYRIAPAVSSPPAGAASGTGIVLTQREKQVVALLTEGASNKLIARRLGISVHTAKFHVAAILQKLGAVNRTDAIAIAMREGLILV